MACSGMLYMQKANYHFSACVQDPNDALQLSGDEGSEPDGGVAAPVPSGDTAAVAGVLAMLASSEPAEAAPAEDVSWMAKRRHTVENDPEHRQFLLDVLQMAGGGGAPPAAVAASPHAGELVQLAQVRSTFAVRAFRVWHVWCSGSASWRAAVCVLTCLHRSPHQRVDRTPRAVATTKILNLKVEIWLCPDAILDVSRMKEGCGTLD